MKSIIIYNIIWQDYYDAYSFNETEDISYVKQKMLDRMKAKNNNGDIIIVISGDWRECTSKEIISKCQRIINVVNNL